MATAIVLSTSGGDRTALMESLPRVLEEAFPEARIRARLLPNGPPVPYPVQFRLVGPDPTVLRDIAERAKALMRADPRMMGINDNWNEKIPVVMMDIDSARAHQLGLTAKWISSPLPDHFSGEGIWQVLEADRTVPNCFCVWKF